MSNYSNEVDQDLADSKLVLRLIMVGMISFLSLFVYWTFEPDPLRIERVDHDSNWSVCEGQVFSFERYVVNTKTIGPVRIDRKLTNLDTGETHSISSISYEGAKTNGVVTYRTTIPQGFGSGEYLYEPTAIYAINPIKVIEKKLPTQKVLFLC